MYAYKMFAMDWVINCLHILTRNILKTNSFDKKRQPFLDLIRENMENITRK